MSRRTRGPREQGWRTRSKTKGSELHKESRMATVWLFKVRHALTESIKYFIWPPGVVKYVSGVPTTNKYEDTLWNIEIKEEFVWDSDPSDHKPVLLHVEAIKGERGHSRSTIKEELVFDPKIQAKIKEIVKECYNRQGSES